MDIIRFKGGLGNQMFQYALALALRSRNRCVGCSLGFYRRHPDKMQFQLSEAFKNIDLQEVKDEDFIEVDKKWKEIKKDPAKLKKYMQDLKEQFFYVEKKDGQYDERIFETQNCAFVGYWQTEKYFKDIRTEVLDGFEFNVKEKWLEELGEKLEDEYFSVHIRRGDYLKFTDLYGGICTQEYYRNAIDYIKKIKCNARFIFFSDDIKWVKSNYDDISNAIFFDGEKFQNYRDWQDMYLMTKCRGNIIANSSFSWWGAWLNRREDNIVISPSKWLNNNSTNDIWPENWIRIDG